jgi:hypothetical protein
MPGGPAIALIIGASATAPMSATDAAESALPLSLRWPSVPADHSLSLEYQLTDRLTQLGNVLGQHLELLSHDMFVFTVDGHRRTAHVRIGGGDARVLELQVEGDLQFEDANAHVCAHVDLAFHGHALHLELPDFEMAPAAYRGDYGVELRLPLFRRSF